MKFSVISLAALAALYHTPAITSVSVVPTAGHADVVVGVESTVDEQDFTLDGPRRVVVDLKGATLSGPAPSYDRVDRGGVTDIRVAQYKANTVRVVIELDSVHSYTVTQNATEVRISVNGGKTDFAAWPGKSGRADPTQNAGEGAQADATAVAGIPAQTPIQVSYTSSSQSKTQPSTQPRINFHFQDADIRDVIAAFALFSGRTIVTGRDVTGTVTAEIHDQPWNVALRAILQGQGLAASEDAASGIITIDSYANIQAKQALEPLVTQLIPINYAKSDSLVPVISKLLARDCGSGVSGTEVGTAGTQVGGSGSGGTSQSGGGGTCITRGAVASNPATNTIIVTETPSRIDDIIRYVQALDIRTPQVSIKAKIIFVDRTDLQSLGLSYDLGTSQQFFTTLVSRIDPSTLTPISTNGSLIPNALGGGTAYTTNQISVGGNTLSAIANANERVVNPALSLVYSAALGKFSLTSFLDALQQVQLADLQAEPSIVTVDNKQANIQVGQDIPIRVIDVSSAGVSGAGSEAPRATVSFRQVGIILNVTPHITNNHQIVLDVHAENSNAEIASSDVGYIFNKQSGDTRILINDGETAVIGGLTVTQISQTKTGIPILVDLPVLGKLFGTTTRSEEKQDLLILITPHVIDANENVGNQGH